MDLKDFVAQTLSQIVQGVEQARGEIGDLAEVGGLPKGLPEGANRQLVNLDHGNGVAQLINFDVALTVESSTAGEGEAGAGIGGWLKVGGSAKHDSSTSSVSRIEFCVPLKLSQEKPPTAEEVTQGYERLARRLADR
tara:strand:+ start:512 stop:922 length:411 start_codon:yes stop_codon:yes gene_type:complete